MKQALQWKKEICIFQHKLHFAGDMQNMCYWFSKRNKKAKLCKLWPYKFFFTLLIFSRIISVHLKGFEFYNNSYFKIYLLFQIWIEKKIELANKKQIVYEYLHDVFNYMTTHLIWPLIGTMLLTDNLLLA